jgi:hypothetical protein
MEIPMLRRVLLVSIVGASACFASPDVGAGVKLAPGLSSIVGTFDCVTHASGGVVWRFHSVNRAWGAWVRADTTFAPQNNQPGDIASTFVGYDAQAKRWNIISIDTDGSYYTRYSRSGAFDGSQWADGDPADGGKAVIRVHGGEQYTFELVVRRNGRDETSVTVCTRAR